MRPRGPQAARGKRRAHRHAAGGARVARTHAARFLLIVGAYFAAAKAGFALTYADASITAIWAPSGIALAALVFWGPRMWPAVTAGAVLANLMSGADNSLLVIALIAAGNTLEGVTGAYLLRARRFDPMLRRARDVLDLCIVGAVATALGALIGVTSLHTFGSLPDSRTASAWLLWWLGDLGGVLIVTPLILVMARERRSGAQRPPIGELAVLLLATAVPSVAFVASSAPVAYLVLPPLVLLAVRCGHLGAALGAALVAGIVIPFTASGRGPFAQFAPDTNLLLSQTFVSAGAITALVLAVLTAERQSARDEAERARVHLEEVLRERTSELAKKGAELAAREEIDRAKDDVLARVFHDIRTPLTSIRGYAELLLTDSAAFEAQPRRFVEIIDRNSTRLLGLVEDLLVLAQHQRGGPVLKAECVDIDALARNAVVMLQPEADRRRISMSVHSPECVHVTGDAARLERLLDNLLTNAIKYAHEGGNVVVGIGAHGSRVVMSVMDDGPGIPAAEQAGIFDRFARTRDALDGGARGFGLGLSIARAIADAHGGSIRLISERGHGARFEVELIRAQPDAAVPSAHGHVVLPWVAPANISPVGARYR